MFGRNKLKSWAKLESLYSHFKKMQMKDLFAADERRADKYTIQFENLLLDYSKNRIDDKIMAALFDFCLLYTSPSPRDLVVSRMPSSA